MAVRVIGGEFVIMSHQTKSRIPLILGVVFAAVLPVFSEQPELTVSSLGEFARAAREDGRRIRLKPGLYRMADFLTDEEVKALRSRIDRSIPRPPVPMLEISGNGNHLNLEGVTLEIDNGLYRKLPPWGYTRCVMITGNGNVLRGLSIRHTGPDVGSGGNTLSVMGTDNTLEDVTLHVRGSFPYGYGDLLGKGVPHLVHLKKQSGIQVVGSRSTLRRCRVFSRAFGHCFYIQEGMESGWRIAMRRGRCGRRRACWRIGAVRRSSGASGRFIRIDRGVSPSFRDT